MSIVFQAPDRLDKAIDSGYVHIVIGISPEYQGTGSEHALLDQWPELKNRPPQPMGSIITKKVGNRYLWAIVGYDKRGVLSKQDFKNGLEQMRRVDEFAFIFIQHGPEPVKAKDGILEVLINSPKKVALFFS